MRKIVYDREQPMTIFAYDDTNEMQRIDVKKRKIPEDAMQFSETPLLYPLVNAISKAKFDDLQQLKQFLQPQYRLFYEKLICDANSVDYGMASGTSDIE